MTISRIFLPGRSFHDNLDCRKLKKLRVGFTFLRRQAGEMPGVLSGD
jgi:hypothetical protein